MAAAQPALFTRLRPHTTWQTRRGEPVMLSEQRRHRRRPVDYAVMLVYRGQRVAGTLRNASRRGLFVAAGLQLQRGDFVWVDCDGSSSSGQLLLAYVRHGNGLGLGLEIDVSQTLAAEQFQTLLQRCSSS